MLYGLVLAGGQSSRMGQDKAQLQFDGQSLLERAQALLGASGCQEVLVSRNQRGFIQDIVVNAGPLGGIHAALAQTPNGAALLVLPVDMPFMDAPRLQALVDAGKAHGRPSYFDDCFLPLYLPVSQAAKDFLGDLLANEGQGRVRRLLDHLDAIALPCPPAPLLQNLNTPADWQQATRSETLS
ncbi:molybdenum cofactor guanylyltransferase [Gallaecimonas pentaromativorans]|uniref:molybdenum cofactor guanylyltransferase n=1 Tax=Gallaecimonas pentaromativorans TaxID=584787 RepID=UPI003A8F694D